MEESGVSADTAAGAEEALLRLKESSERYSLVLFDWNIPDIGAAEAAKRLRNALPDTSPLPYCL